MTESPTINGMFQSFAARPTVQQFLRFCIVGASSTAISATIYFTLLSPTVRLDHLLFAWLAGWPGVQQLAAQWHADVPLANFAGFLFGVTNGFIWNSRWTFPQSDPEARHKQAVKFVIVNIIGVSISTVIVWAVTMVLSHGRMDDVTVLVKAIAFISATGITMFWNFTGSKYLAFKS